MSDPCGNTGKPIWGCPCENCTPETYEPVDDKCLAEYDEAGHVENEWRLVHTCKEIRRLHQENERLTQAWKEVVKKENLKLRKVVEAAWLLASPYYKGDRFDKLREALRELDKEPS